MVDVLVAIRLGDRSGRAFVLKRPKVGQRASERAAQSIAREAEVLFAVRSPSIVALEAAGDIAGLPYVATEYVRGLSLDDLRASSQPLPEEAVRAVALDMATALHALHHAGYVHGDISPSNVLLDDTGEIRLCDFGLAEKQGAKRSAIAGKPGYIAPEAVRPVESNPAEDIYSLGVVIGECTLGKRLFMETSLADAGARGDVPAYEAALEQIAKGFGNALKRDPSARPTAASLLEALRELPNDRRALADAVAAASAQNPAVPAPPPALPAPEKTPTPPPAALTPTIPMKLSILSDDLNARAPARHSTALHENSIKLTGSHPPHPHGAPNGWKTLALFLLAFVIALGAFFAGRFSGRARQSTLAYGGPWPRRTQIELDGQRIDRNAGPIPIDQGRHTIVFITAKGDKREVNFTARPGEQVVLFPINKQGNLIVDQEDRGE